MCREVYNETKAEYFLSVFAVALLAEGVDRNYNMLNDTLTVYASPSSRRAWIEISVYVGKPSYIDVALLAEGVDRNIALGIVKIVLILSPSSRRAWIEISGT